MSDFTRCPTCKDLYTICHDCMAGENQAGEKPSYGQVCRARDELKDQLDDRHNTIEQALHDQYTEKVVPLALELQKWKSWAIEARELLGDQLEDPEEQGSLNELLLRFPGGAK